MGIGHRASGIGHRASGIGHRASGIGHRGLEVESSNILYSLFFLLPSSLFLKSVTSVTSVTESVAELPSSSLTDRTASFRRAENAPVRGGLLA
ncbi:MULTISPECIES: hypothetical protein [unclassified Microcoleus]|uniref:hypothetical protein n=1 Tax=unclassified Microcoleus TaxID=2642155 RepID=UPI002FD0F1DC